MGVFIKDLGDLECMVLAYAEDDALSYFSA
jgi:hypothetical protein